MFTVRMFLLIICFIYTGKPHTLAQTCIIAGVHRYLKFVTMASIVDVFLLRTGADLLEWCVWDSCWSVLCDSVCVCVRACMRAYIRTYVLCMYVHMCANTGGSIDVCTSNMANGYNIHTYVPLISIHTWLPNVVVYHTGVTGVCYGVLLLCDRGTFCLLQVEPYSTLSMWGWWDW